MSTLRVTTAGESHGPAEVCVLSGVPAGMALTAEAIDRELARRQQGYGRGGRMAIETDRCRFLSGVRHGVTLGSPIAMMVENRDHVNWLEAMSPAPLPEGRDRPAPLSIPRPGHADFAGMAKYGHRDMRNVLERASARETVGRVAGGAVCKRLLEELGVKVRGRVTRVGGVATAEPADLAHPECIDWEAVEASPVACDEPPTSRQMCDAIDQAREAGESLGGVFEIWCWTLCPGLGGYASPEDRLDGRLLGAVGSIPAIKGVEIGYGFAGAAEPGSRVHDPFILREEPGARWTGRAGNNAGGVEGGVSTGMPLVVRAAMKPIPTLTTPLPSVDVAALQPVSAHIERSDVTAVPAARVVAEAMVAYVIAGAYLEKFGGDSLPDLLGSVAAYEKRLEDRGLWRRS
jgi:chorismate synthase